MSLSLALNNALSGLNINQRQLAVLSQNIANANTAGYSRQVLNQSAVYVNSVGQGVQVESVSRKVDTYLQRAVQTQSASVGGASTMNEYYARMQVLFGQPGQQNAVDASVSRFFNAIQSLAQSPDIVSRQQNAISSATALASHLSGLARETHTLRFEADQDIGNAVRYINQQIKDLHAVNTAINRAYTLGSDLAGLEDQRDILIGNVARYIDINPTFKASGEVQISTTNGVALLDQSAYQLDYTSVPSADALINDAPLSPLKVYRLDPNGARVGEPATLVSGGPSGQVASTLKGGSLKALVELRDKTLPGVLDQLDVMASTMRDRVNTIHNNGTGFPAAHSLTGTRSVTGQSVSQWEGSVRIALLNAQGKPIPSAFPGETSVQPLTIDLSSLNSGGGNGRATVQDIINEINAGFTPQNKVRVGNLNNIRLASNTPSLPQTPPSFSFDFDLENISGSASNFFVSNVVIRDAGGVALPGNVTSTVPTVALAGTNTFVTHAAPDDDVLTINTANPHGFTEGQRIYINDPAIVPDINGIASSAVNGYFVISNVTATGFDITIPGQSATSAGGVNASGKSVQGAYETVAPGTTQRTRDSGTFTADLSANPTSLFYDVEATVAVEDGQGGFTTTTITYRVPNNQPNLLNQRYSAVGVGAGGTLVQPTATQPYAVAKLVDANGKELPKINGVYAEQAGYLKIETVNGSYSVAIDEMNSKQVGSPYDNPPQPGTNWGFSHYFEMNNFFKSNAPGATGNAIKNSAISLAVEDRIRDNPSLVSLGQLVRSAQPLDPGATPIYTYERLSGDAQAIKAIADLANQTVALAAAGGLPASVQTISGYAAQFLGLNAAQAASAESNLMDGELLLNGFEQRSQAISGVNLDEELANTIIYQNAYTASARIISVTNDLYDSLLSTFQ